jgi:cytochrome b
MPNGIATPQPPRPDDAASAMAKVWDLPQRIVHWTLALAVLIAWCSANIFDAVHEMAGYAALGLVAFRIAWGFFGSYHARFAHFVRRPAGVLQYLRRLADRRAERYLGHNPAGAAMILALLATIVISTISGWMQITERFFGVDWVEAVHTYSSHLVLILAAMHVAGVLLMCALQRENLVLAMITGRKRRERAGE